VSKHVEIKSFHEKEFCCLKVCLLKRRLFVDMLFELKAICMFVEMKSFCEKEFCCLRVCLLK